MMAPFGPDEGITSAPRSDGNAGGGRGVDNG
jgi:hypothetical protein